MPEDTRDIALKNQVKIDALNEKVTEGFDRIGGTLISLDTNIATLSKLNKNVENLSGLQAEVEGIQKWRGQTENRMKIIVGTMSMLSLIGGLVFTFAEKIRVFLDN